MLFVNISDIFLSYCQRAIYWVSASSALNRATPHFYPFQFSEIKYLPLGLCAGVWIWPNSLLQRRRVWKKYSRARQHTQIQWCKYILENIEFERNTVEQGSEIQRPNTFLRALRSCDLESGQCFPFRIGPGAVFPFCQSWFLSDSSSCWRLWQERRLTLKFAPSSIFACIANRN